MAHFSKRHYIAASVALRTYRGASKPAIVYFLLDLFGQDNREFNKARFVLDAGGLIPAAAPQSDLDGRQ